MGDIDPTKFFKTQQSVSFNEKIPSSYNGGGSTSGFAIWLINHSGGLIQTKKTANTALIALFILFVIISVLLIWPEGDTVDVERDPLTGEEVIPGQVFGEI